MTENPFPLDSPLPVLWEYASDARTLREYIAASITRAHLAENVPDFEGSLEIRSAHVVFVAEK